MSTPGFITATGPVISSSRPPPAWSAGLIHKLHLGVSLVRVELLDRFLAGRGSPPDVPRIRLSRPFQRVSAFQVYSTFHRENWRKDESWALRRLDEATLLFGGWHQGTMTAEEILEVMLPDSPHFHIPPAGMTAREALKLPRVQAVAARPEFTDSHLCFSVLPVVPPRGGAVEYRTMRGHEGRLVHLDGLNRLLSWALMGKQEMKVFVAGLRPGR